MSVTPSPVPTFLRWARTASRQILLLNLGLFAVAWVLYGTFAMRGYGKVYYIRSDGFWLEGVRALVFEGRPGIENVLLPGIAALVKAAWVRLGYTYGGPQYLVVSILPYVMFVYLVGVLLRRRAGSDGIVAVAAVVALYASGFVPYMTSWGGYVDGMSYLLLVPVLVWPGSFSVFAVTFVLHALNHYLGAMALLLLVCLRASLDAVKTAQDAPRAALTAWFRTVAPRLLWAAVVIAVSWWYWSTRYPVPAHERGAILAERWHHVGEVFVEVLGRFPFTVLSTYKLIVVPMTMLALLRTGRFRWLRIALLAMPAVVAGVGVVLFVDVTRVATLLLFPLFWMLIVAVTGQASDVAPVQARRLRRVFIVAAAFSLLVPNYYINNGELLVPESPWIRAWAAALGRTLQ